MMETDDPYVIAALITEIGQRMEFKAEPHKARAYYRAAESLRQLQEPLADLIEQNRVREIPGVGAAIEEKILTLSKTGTHPTLERLRAEIPAEALDMLRIPGLTPDKAQALYEHLDIRSIPELEAAAESGLLVGTKGFGAALQAKILSGIQLLRENQGLLRIDIATERAHAACLLLQTELPDLSDIVPAGDVRRWVEVVSEPLPIVARGKTPESTTQDGIALHVTDAPHYGLVLVRETGSRAHWELLQAHARTQGLTLEPERLMRGNEEIFCPAEADVYAALGLPLIPPELREGQDEIELARQNHLPNLITDADMRGILHCHTTFSDGTATVEEMAETTMRLGYEYWGIADHSRSASYAGGLKEDKLAEQQRQVDELNKRYAGSGFWVFKGTECDILADGALDYSDEILDSFDYVVASIHSRFALDEDAQTARLVRAVSHPRVTILGHMTGRLLLQRKGYAVDIEQVLQACAAHGVAVEINADPHRLDLDWRWHRRALELGCLISINPDAHSTGGLQNVHWGIKMARKGGIPADRVLNCMDLETITRHFEARRKKM
jgi:DNA polymerase (family X)